VTDAAPVDPLILSLHLDAESFARFDALRKRHFPPALNKIPAHVTVFHHLPGKAEAEIAHELRSACAGTPVLPVRVTGLKSMGRGVAYQLASSELSALRARLAARWAPWLNRQDQQAWRPHVTVQNKVEPEQARALLEHLSRGFQPYDVRAEGLLLWRYRGGPWEAAGAFPFSAPSAP
jgi:2'-5' RNA ligase